MKTMNRNFSAMFVALLLVISTLSFAFAQDNATDLNVPAVLNDSSADQTDTDSENGTVNEQEENESISAETELETAAPTDIELDAGDDTITLVQEEVFEREIAGTLHQIKVVDVSDDENTCGISVDGDVAWVDVGSDIEINGVKISVIDITKVPSDVQDTDTCRVGIEGAESSQESGDESQSIAIPKNETPSITPDQPFLWGIKRAIEKIDYLITIGKSAKAQKGLEHARERLLEVQAMIAAKKFDAAEKAAKAHEQNLEQAEADIESIGNGDTEKEIEIENELQNQVTEQDKHINRLKIKVKEKFKGQNLADAEAVLASFEDSNSEVRLKVVEKKEKTKIKIKAKTESGEREVEIEEESEKREESADEDKNSTEDESEDEDENESEDSSDREDLSDDSEKEDKED